MVEKKTIKDLKEILWLIAEYELVCEQELDEVAYGSELDRWFQGLSAIDQKIIRQYQDITIQVKDNFGIKNNDTSPLSRFWERLEDKRN